MRYGDQEFVDWYYSGVATRLEHYEVAVFISTGLAIENWVQDRAGHEEIHMCLFSRTRGASRTTQSLLKQNKGEITAHW